MIDPAEVSARIAVFAMSVQNSARVQETIADARREHEIIMRLPTEKERVARTIALDNKLRPVLAKIGVPWGGHVAARKKVRA